MIRQLAGLLLIAALPTTVVATAASAQQVPARTPLAQTPPSADIIVGPDAASIAAAGNRLRTARLVFDAQRLPHAPDAELYFALRGRSAADGPVPPATLTVGSRTIDLAFDADGRTHVPADVATDIDWMLHMAPSATAIRLRPVVFSPGSQMNDRRVGDLRVQCRLFFGIIAVTLSAEEQQGFTMLGGCDGPMFTFNVTADRPVATAMIGDHRLTLVRDGAAVGVPINDATISDDARVVMTYR